MTDLAPRVRELLPSALAVDPGARGVSVTLPSPDAARAAVAALKADGLIASANAGSPVVLVYERAVLPAPMVRSSIGDDIGQAVIQCGCEVALAFRGYEHATEEENGMKSAPPPRGLPENLPDLGASVGAAFGRGVHSRPMREAAVSAADLRAPFPWFGGKSRVAADVWERFGDVPNYVEPFAGSLAVLLARPHEPRVETINDLDCYVANAWRAIRHAPALVAAEADQPVNEADLHAIHRWLVFGPEGDRQPRRPMMAALSLLEDGDVAGAQQVLRAALAEDRPLGPDFRTRMRRDPEYFDAEIAGRWLWGICAWIGSGWCTTDADEFHENEGKRPELGAGGEGAGRPRAGKGVHAPPMAEKLPLLGGTKGTGRSALYQVMERLAARLRYTRVACGDWSRVVTDSVTWRHGTTALFLDPPYSDEVRAAGLYAVDSGEVASEVLRWCREHGADTRLRIALCGYDTEGHGEALPGWEVLAWRAKGGYGGQRKRGEKNMNQDRERIWFSPGCLKSTGPAQLSLL